MGKIFYELTRDGDNLRAKVCEPFDLRSSEVEIGPISYTFDGRKMSSFFKKRSDIGYQFACGQEIVYYKGKIVLPLWEEECLTSDEPIDRFSWEDDEDVSLPNHQIILEE